MQARRWYAPLLLFWFCPLFLGGSVRAQTQFALLEKSHLPREAREGWPSYGPRVALGDVDGDRDIDLITWIHGALPQVRLHLNDGTAIFTERQNAIQVDGFLMPLGDLDGDGDLDLILFPNVLLNDGKGNFTHAPGRIPAAYGVPVLGDVDGDKDLDIVIGGTKSAARLLLNDGKGKFTDASSTQMPFGGFETRSIILVDVDGDRDLDVVFGNTPIHESHKVTPSPNLLYLNDGKGKFTDATKGQLPAFPSDYTRSVVAADVDRDGDVDLVMGNSPGQSRLFLNDGKGSFTVAAGKLTLAGSVAELLFVDIEADGDPDLLVSSGSSARTQGGLYLNDGKGGFAADPPGRRVPPEIWLKEHFASGDVDGDGDPDLLVTSRELKVQLALNDGKGFFANATPPRLPPNRNGSYRFSMALADVDGDGDLDRAMTGNDYSNDQDIVRFALNDGSGSFSPAPSLTLRPAPDFLSGRMVFDDVDRDGDLDLFVMVNSVQGIYYPKLYLNNGKGVFSDGTSSRLPASSQFPALAWGTFTLGDVDGDGDTDLVLFGGANKLFLNNGKGFFTEATGRLPGVRGPIGILALGDVDGDRDLDLVTWSYNQFAKTLVRLYSNDGKGTFTDVTATRMPTTADGASAIAFGDVDGDGDVDLVIGNGSYLTPLPNRLYLNDGKGKFTDVTAKQMPNVAAATMSLSLVDVDLDGDLDFFAGESQKATRLYLNDGKGRFTDSGSRGPVIFEPYANQFVVGDVDADGDPDLLLWDQLFFNLHRQTDARYLARLGYRYQIDFYSQPGYGSSDHVALPFVAAGRAKLLVPPFGTFGLDPNVMIVLNVVPVRKATGMGSVRFKIPRIPALNGRSIFIQALVAPSANPLSWRLTNVNFDVIRSL